MCHNSLPESVVIWMCPQLPCTQCMYACAIHKWWLREGESLLSSTSRLYLIYHNTIPVKTNCSSTKHTTPSGESGAIPRPRMKIKKFLFTAVLIQYRQGMNGTVQSRLQRIVKFVPIIIQIKFRKTSKIPAAEFKQRTGCRL